VPRNRPGKHCWGVDAETVDLIRALARHQPDRGVAAILNRAGKRTGKGNTWTQARVCSFRSAHAIAVYRQGELAERGELTLEQAAERLKVSKMTVLRLIGSGIIQAQQVCRGAPWASPETQLAGLDPLSLPSRRPVTTDPDQKTFYFQ